MEQGSFVSLIARQHRLTEVQLFQWHKASLVAVGANQTVAGASDLQDAMTCIRQLEGALGRKSLEN